jgi:hypothetical protein
LCANGVHDRLKLALCRFVWKLHRWPICDSHRCGATGSRERPTQVRSMPGQRKERDTLCHQGLSPQSLDSTSIFQLSPPCNRIKAKPFGWTSSSLDPFARQVKTRVLHSQRQVKFHTKRRRTLKFRFCCGSGFGTKTPHHLNRCGNQSQTSGTKQA